MTGSESATAELVALIDRDDYATVEALLERGADVNARDRRGLTPLMWAVQRRNSSLALLLLEKGADVNAADDGGYTPLMYAAGYHALADVLIASGADVNAADKWGQTALMHAAGGGDIRMMELLLREGASFDARALDLAASSWWAGARPCKLLLDRGADVNGRSGDGQTALLTAAKHLNVDAVRLLISRGADVNARNDAGETALTLARRDFATVEEKKIVRMLMRDGASA